MKKIGLLLMLALMTVLFTACDSGDGNKTEASYKDGTYTGRSSDFEEDESGNGSGYGTVEITIENNKITACEFKMYELDGTLKDENYGADLSKENRLKAQKAVQSAEKYSDMLVSRGSLSEVDVISGATISFSEFKEAVENALKSAEE